jgi:hypothetical protein
VNRAEVEARRKLKQDVRSYLEERDREEEDKVATREAQEHAKSRDAQEQEEELKYMRKIMYENKTELDRMKNTVQELREENRKLLKENESLSKSATTKSICNQQYNASHMPEFKTISRKALIRGSAINKETYDEDPRGYRDTGMYGIDGTPKWGVPRNKDMKLQLAKFAAKETYKGLGTGINEWIERFIRQLQRALLASGFCWSESVKMDVLEDHLEGKALEFWQIKRKTWDNSTLEEAMNALNLNYKRTLSDRQAMTLFDKEKPSHRGFKEHLNYLLQMDAAGGGHYSRNVLKSLVHRSGPKLMHEISSKYDRSRTNYIEHATELADFADELWNERNLSRHTGRAHREGSQVNAITSRRDTRTCEYCKKKGHVSKFCRSRKKATEGKDKDSFAFSVGYDKDVEEEGTSSIKEDVLHTKIEWILDSGCGRHLTGNASLFDNNTNAARTSLILPDGTKGNIQMITRIGQAT